MQLVRTCAGLLLMLGACAPLPESGSPDASGGRDASSPAPDAATSRDAALTPDAATSMDAAILADAAMSMDAAWPVDSGAMTDRDASGLVDADAMDGGGAADAGPLHPLAASRPREARAWSWNGTERPASAYTLRLWHANFATTPLRSSTAQRLAAILDALQFSYGTLGMFRQHDDEGLRWLETSSPELPILAKGYGMPLLYEGQMLEPRHRDRRVRLRDMTQQNRQLSTAVDPSEWALEITPAGCEREGTCTGDERPGLLVARSTLRAAFHRNHRTNATMRSRLWSRPIEVAPLEQLRPGTPQFLPSADCDRAAGVELHSLDDMRYGGTHDPVQRTECLALYGPESDPGLHWNLQRCLADPECAAAVDDDVLAGTARDVSSDLGSSLFSETFGERPCWKARAGWFGLEAEEGLERAVGSFPLDWMQHPFAGHFSSEQPWGGLLFRWSCEPEDRRGADPTLALLERSSWSGWLTEDGSLACDTLADGSAYTMQSFSNAYWEARGEIVMGGQCFEVDPGKPATGEVIADALIAQREVLGAWGLATDNFTLALRRSPARTGQATVALPLRDDPTDPLEAPRFLLGHHNPQATIHYLSGYDALTPDAAHRQMQLNVLDTTDRIRTRLSEAWEDGTHRWMPNVNSLATAFEGAVDAEGYHDYETWLRRVERVFDGFWDEKWGRCNAGSSTAQRRLCYEKLAAAYLADLRGVPALLDVFFSQWNDAVPWLRERDVTLPEDAEVRGRQYRLAGGEWTTARAEVCRFLDGEGRRVCPAAATTVYGLEAGIVHTLLAMQGRAEGSSLLVQPIRRFGSTPPYFDNYLDGDSFAARFLGGADPGYAEPASRTWVGALMDLRAGAPTMTVAGITGRSPSPDSHEHYELMYRQYENALALFNVVAAASADAESGDRWVVLPPSPGADPDRTYYYLRMRSFEGGLVSDGRGGFASNLLEGHSVHPLSCAVAERVNLEKVRACHEYARGSRDLRTLQACRSVCEDPRGGDAPPDSCERDDDCGAGWSCEAGLCTTEWPWETSACNPSRWAGGDEGGDCPPLMTVEAYAPGESIRIERGRRILFVHAEAWELFDGVGAAAFARARAVGDPERSLVAPIDDTPTDPSPVVLETGAGTYTHFLSEPVEASGDRLFVEPRTP